MNSPLNLLLITHHIKTASIPRAYAFGRQMVARGHRVSLLLISEHRRLGCVEYDWDGIHAIESPDLLWGRLRTGWDLWGAFNRRPYLAKSEERYDLVHCFETRPATIYPARYLIKKEHMPMVTDWNDWWGHHGLIDVNRPAWYRVTLGWLETYYEEHFRVDAAGLTVIATALKQRAVNLGMDPANICFIPGGAFTDRYLPHGTEECRTHAHLPLDGPILGFGSADSHLDIEIILASLVTVAEEYPTVKLIITGKTKAEVRQLVKKYRLENKVLFVGFVSQEDYPWVLGCADVFLLPMADRPYNHGRWPNKMSDYLCFGRPTVSNPIGDIKTLFEKYPVGLLADYNAADFAAKVIYLLDHPDLCNQLGQTARWVAENEFNWHTLGDRLEEFYYEVINRANQSA